MGRIQYYIFMFIVSVLAILSCYLFYKTIFLEDPILHFYPSSPDVKIQDIQSTSFDNEGKISTTMTAPQMTYSNSNKQADFIQPTIMITQGHAAPWHITADSGKAYQDSKLYQLRGHVLLNQGPTQKSKHVLIATSELNIYSDKRIAETDKPISYTQVNQDNTKVTVHAVGAIANQNTGEIITKSHSNRRMTIQLDPEQKP